MSYDYLVVGSGLFGSTFAREITDAGFKCLVIDCKNHIGGSAYTEVVDDIVVHVYGGHIFHTNSDKVWNFVNRFAYFNHYIHQVKVFKNGLIYSFPINLFTLYQLWGIKTPEEAKKRLEEVKIVNPNPKNLEEWILSQVGEELYRNFIYGYTKKQWGTEPKNLPASIIQRLPIRMTMNDQYFSDRYQGIPAGGYTPMFEKMLSGIPVELNTDYLKNREEFDRLAKKVVYTGALDSFFEYDLGRLGWRSLDFEHQRFESENMQGNSVINYPDENVKWTKILEHKYFEFKNQPTTILTKEIPADYTEGRERFYPINTDENLELRRKYWDRIDSAKYIFGGRLGNYQYYDMHQVIAEAMKTAELEIKL